ncbi:MAG: tetratricopeptide repeat protein [Salinibacterium sp.]|nr:tetratricopeptide repeat protein [Salinibacterium sp.]
MRFPALKQALAPLAAGLVLFSLPLSGCSGPSKQSSEFKNEASARLDALKAGTEWELARQRYESGDFQQALQGVDRSLALNPQVAKSHTLKGRILVEMGQTQAAMESLARAIALDPEHAEAYFYRGLIFERIARFEEAYQEYSKALEANPEKAQYVMAAAEMLIRMERLDEAEALLVSSSDRHEFTAGIRQTLGHIAMMRHRPQDAVEYFSEAQVLSPDDMSILEDLALSEIEAGHFAEAEAHLQDVIEHQPDDQPQRRDLLHLLARCQMEQDDLIDARQTLINLTRGREGAADALAWTSLGTIAMRYNDTDHLHDAGERLIRLRPRRYEGYYFYAMWEHSQGFSERALKTVSSAVALESDDAMPLVLKAIILSEMGRDADAAVEARQALALEPSNPEIQALARQLGVP